MNLEINRDYSQYLNMNRCFDVVNTYRITKSTSSLHDMKPDNVFFVKINM